jgi:hypothetical protein
MPWYYLKEIWTNVNKRNYAAYYNSFFLGYDALYIITVPTEK